MEPDKSFLNFTMGSQTRATYREGSGREIRVATTSHSFVYVSLWFWKHDHVEEMYLFHKFSLKLFLKLLRKPTYSQNSKAEREDKKQAHCLHLHECRGNSQAVYSKCLLMLLTACGRWVLPFGAAIQVPQVAQSARGAQSHWGLRLQRCSHACSSVATMPGRASQRNPAPTPLAMWGLIGFSCSNTEYLCKQHVQTVTCKRTCDTFMKYAKYDMLRYDLNYMCIWKPFPCFGSGTEHFWQFVWGKQIQSVSMIHKENIWQVWLTCSRLVCFQSTCLLCS